MAICSRGNIIRASWTGLSGSGFFAKSRIGASFALIITKPEDKLSVDHSLNIRISSLIERIDTLPKTLSGSFDQEALLDKVFSTAGTSMALPSQPNSLAIPMPQENQEFFSLTQPFSVRSQVVANPDGSPALRTQNLYLRYTAC